MFFSKIFVKCFAKFIGQDEFGNRYYSYKKHRFVRHKLKKQTLRIPPLWHAWLYNVRQIPPEKIEFFSRENINLNSHTYKNRN